MKDLPVFFDIVIFLFKQEQRKVIRKKVSSLYLSTYLDVGYKMVGQEIENGWKIYSIQLEHFSIEKVEIQTA